MLKKYFYKNDGRNTFSVPVDRALKGNYDHLLA